MTTPFTRHQLSKFIEDPRTLRSFEELQATAINTKTQTEDLGVRISDLGNPGAIVVESDYPMTDAYKAVYINAPGITVTLPQATTAREGVIWTITMGVAGTATLVCADGDSFPTPDVSVETTILFDTRGTTLDFRCIEINRWAIV